MHRVSALVTLLAAATACSSASAPSTTSIAGRWGGSTCPPSLIVSCSIAVDITQSGSALSGTWGFTTSNGTLNGTLTGSSVSMVMTPQAPPGCVWTVVATADGDQMTGTHSVVLSPTCGGATGAIALTRVR